MLNTISIMFLSCSIFVLCRWISMVSKRQSKLKDYIELVDREVSKIYKSYIPQGQNNDNS